ncbi:hypothetical protein [Bradyrhizobium sp. AZCC 1693]|uniref:hypothetical protein n=1 Tax=Bradyrhizobium sp. AZCC 1693 TaxID=3117029 RepID=UPI002FF1137C
MSSIPSGEWLANIKSVMFVIGSLGAVSFAVLGAVAKLCDENLQKWTTPTSDRQRALWRVRAQFHYWFRRLHYNKFHELFYKAIEDSRSFLMSSFLRPDPVFENEPHLKGWMPYLFLLPMAVLFTWVYYILLQTLLTTPELIIPKSLADLSSGALPLIRWHDEDKAWGGMLVTLLAIPVFTIVPVTFSIGWGFAAIALWHQLISGLPGNLGQYYRSFSAIPRLIVLSFGLTALALVLGKLTSPLAPVPLSPRTFAVNTFFDALSVLVAWHLLREAPPPPGFRQRPSARLFFAILRLGVVGIATGVFAILSLYLSLLKTPNEVPLAVALNTFIARPTPPDALYSLKTDSGRPFAEDMIEKTKRAAKTKSLKVYLQPFFLLQRLDLKRYLTG